MAEKVAVEQQNHLLANVAWRALRRDEGPAPAVSLNEGAPMYARLFRDNLTFAVTDHGVLAGSNGNPARRPLDAILLREAWRATWMSEMRGAVEPTQDELAGAAEILAAEARQRWAEIVAARKLSDQERVEQLTDELHRQQSRRAQLEQLRRDVDAELVALDTPDTPDTSPSKRRWGRFTDR